jgi:sulfotransferase family protein
VYVIESDRYARQASKLNPDTLLLRAQDQSGLTDYGDMRFAKRMRDYLDRAAREVEFNDQGLDAFSVDAVRYLVNRLRMHHDLQRHPEILKEDVSAPLFIIGLPRSGTTKMQRMIATDPHVQKLYTWQIFNPAPFPNAERAARDPRIKAAADVLAGVSSVGGSQAVQAAHVMASEQVEEDGMLFDFTFEQSVVGYSTHIPLLFMDDWEAGDRFHSLAVDRRAAYQYVHTMFQYLQWQNKGTCKGPWLLKSVTHHPHIDILLECFPNAKFIHCHRDPLKAIPSIAKLMWAFWSAKAKVDKHFVGDTFVRWGELGTKRYLQLRDSLGLESRILDINYDSIRDGGMPLIRQAYELAGWDLTPEAATAMMNWERANEQGKHGEHRYSLEEFGLTEGQVNRAFKEYIERFIRH